MLFTYLQFKEIACSFEIKHKKVIIWNVLGLAMLGLNTDMLITFFMI